MTPALLVVIMLTANPAENMKVTVQMDTLTDCINIAKVMRTMPQVLFAGCAVKKVEETKTDYSVEQGV